MKTTRLPYLLTLGLVATLVATGCRTKQQSLTKLPEPSPRPSTVADAPRINPDGKPDLTSTDLDQWDPSDFINNHEMFAAETVHFGYDSVIVKQTEMVHVKTVAETLCADSSTRLLIEGHCDERGTEEYNRSLGERRALALRIELARLGIDPARVLTRSFGEDQPVDRGQTEAAWSKNRRGEFVLLSPKQ